MPDKIANPKMLEGKWRKLAPDEAALEEQEPDEVVNARETRRMFPPPADPEAQALAASIREAIYPPREKQEEGIVSDPRRALELNEEFRRRFGFYSPNETLCWYALVLRGAPDELICETSSANVERHKRALAGLDVPEETATNPPPTQDQRLYQLGTDLRNDAWYRTRAGRDEEAFAKIEEAIACEPGIGPNGTHRMIDRLGLKGVVLWKLGRTEESLESMATASTLDGDEFRRWVQANALEYKELAEIVKHES